MSHIKILYIDQQSYNNLSVYDGSLIGSLPDGCDVAYLCSSLYDGPELNKGVIHPIFTYNNKRGILKVLSYLFSIVRLLFFSIKFKPDIIHVQWLIVPFIDTRVFKVIRVLVHSKVVFTAHNILPHDTGNKYKRIYQSFYDFVDAIIVHDRITKDELASIFCVATEKIKVIHHGILRYRVDEKKIEEEITDLRRKFDITPDRLLFSVVGIQSKYKGTDVILNSWANNTELSGNKSAQLIIAGRCSELDYTSFVGLSNIHIEDAYISTERLIAILRLSDVVLLPYRKISQSGVLLSAIEFEKPFLVTDVGGLAEPLKYGDVGWLINNCSEEELTPALIGLVNDIEGVKDKANNKGEWLSVKKAYSWDEIGKQTAELYETMLKKGSDA